MRTIVLSLVLLPELAYADCVYTGAKRAYLECIYGAAVDAGAGLVSLMADVTGLSDRLDVAEGDVTSLGAGLAAAQGDVASLQGDVGSLDGRLDTVELDVDALMLDYLGLGDVGTTAGTVAAGDDARFGQWTGSSTGLDAAAGRTSLGLGSAALASTASFATAAQGTTADNALPRSGGTVTGALTVTGATTLSGGLTLGSSLAAENGYTRLPNGFIMQWGVVPANAAHPRRFSFPIAFPNEVFSIVSSVRENNIILSNPVLISTSQADMYVWKSNDATIDNTHGVYWFAIGR